VSTEMLINILVISAIAFLALAFILFRAKKPALNETSVRKTLSDAEKYNIEAIHNFVKTEFNSMTNSNLHDMGLDEEDFDRRKNKRDALRKALKACNSGSITDKNYVKELMFDIIQEKYGLDETNIEYVIPFNGTRTLTTQDKWDILIHVFKKKHGYDALTELITKYEMDKLKKSGPNEEESYVVTALDVEKAYMREEISLAFEDKLSVVIQRVYQRYKGFGIVDEIRDMNIDGVSGGVSGLPLEYDLVEASTGMFGDVDYAKDTWNSAWIFFKGKTMHLPFLTFEKEAELKRICQNIYRYNNPGQLSESSGYIVNEMKDGSRVVVVRPGFAESWAFFVRRFTIANMSPETLIQGGNSDFAVKTLNFLVKGQRIMSLSGEPGSGKTSLLMALVKFIDPTFNIRVQEMAFELNLRKIYPKRNILSFRETDKISGQAGLDLHKKTDMAVNLVGEVATDPVGAWVIQAGQVASLFTLFTHHAKTFDDLITSLRNSLLKTKIFRDERIAEQQVVSVINFDIHLIKKRSGERYIERITECVPVKDTDAYPTPWMNMKSDDPNIYAAMMETMTEFMKRQTDRKVYVSRDIVVYKDGKYVPGEGMTQRTLEDMKKHMTSLEIEEFDDFVQTHWGNAN